MFTLERITQAAASLVLRYGVKGFTIDPWNTVEHDFSSMTETQYIERALNKLTIFKQVHDIAIFLVAHPKKIAKREEGVYEVPSLYDIAGSSNFYNKCDFGITVYRNFTAGVSEIYIQKCKYKNLGEIGYTKLVYDFMTNRFCSVHDEYNKSSFLPKPQQATFEDDMFSSEGIDDVPF
jgi:twinkle protein